MNVNDIEIKKNPPIYGLIYTPEATNFDNDEDKPFKSFSKEVSDEVYSKVFDLVNERKDSILSILEIGILRPSNKQVSTTKALISASKKECIYLGVDLEDRTSMQEPKNNVFVLRTNSHNQDIIRGKLKELGVEKISVLFIDGWHSINTVVNDWRYADLLDETGFVLFHDVNQHPGPYHILPAIDTEIFEVVNYFEDKDDYGLAVAFKK